MVQRGYRCQVIRGNDELSVRNVMHIKIHTVGNYTVDMLRTKVFSFVPVPKTTNIYKNPKTPRLFTAIAIIVAVIVVVEVKYYLRQQFRDVEHSITR